ncbi:MAG: hypothetical protein DRJ40_03930 [Thermoprotei archaeon]|nr:MAG: hypothetical protein DRJ40_03930 [Thermoprotei archaeon]
MFGVVRDLFRELRCVLRGNSGILIVTWCIFSLGEGIFIYESLYLRALGAGSVEIGYVVSLSSAAFVSTLLIGSYIADALGRRKVVIIGTFLLASTYLLYSLARSWCEYAVGSVIHELVRGVYAPALMALYADSLPSSARALGFAISRVVPHAFAIPSPYLVGYVVERWGVDPGLRYMLMLFSFLALVAACLRLKLAETLRVQVPRSRRALRYFLEESIRSIVDFWRLSSRDLRLLISIYVPSAFYLVFFRNYLVLYVIDVVGLSKFEWGIALSLAMAAGLLVGVPLGRLGDVIGRRRSIFIGCSIEFIALLFLAVIPHRYVALAVPSVLTVATSISSPAISALLTDLSPIELRGRAMGVTMFALNVSAIAVGTLMGYAYSLNPLYVIYLALAAPVLTILITYFVHEHRSYSK